jgi:hypothetical protein
MKRTRSRTNPDHNTKVLVMQVSHCALNGATALDGATHHTCRPNGLTMFVRKPEASGKSESVTIDAITINSNEVELSWWRFALAFRLVASRTMPRRVASRAPCRISYSASHMYPASCRTPCLISVSICIDDRPVSPPIPLAAARVSQYCLPH